MSDAMSTPSAPTAPLATPRAKVIILSTTQYPTTTTTPYRPPTTTTRMSMAPLEADGTKAPRARKIRTMRATCVPVKRMSPGVRAKQRSRE